MELAWGDPNKSIKQKKIQEQTLTCQSTVFVKGSIADHWRKEWMSQ